MMEMRVVISGEYTNLLSITALLVFLITKISKWLGLCNPLNLSTHGFLPLNTPSGSGYPCLINNLLL